MNNDNLLINIIVVLRVDQKACGGNPSFNILRHLSIGCALQDKTGLYLAAELFIDMIGNCMKTPRNLLLLSVLPFMIAGCVTKDSMFEQSAYGREVESMMTACIDAQQNGQLPGITAGKDDSLEFVSDAVVFSDRNNVHYPLALTCTVISNGQNHTFRFSKQSATSKWALSL